MLHFTRWSDTHHVEFIKVSVCQNYQNRTCFEKVSAEMERVQFFVILCICDSHKTVMDVMGTWYICFHCSDSPW